MPNNYFCPFRETYIDGKDGRDVKANGKKNHKE